MKTKLSLLSLAVCAVFSSTVYAQDSGTINFTGTIQSAACTADFGGGGATGGNVNLGFAPASSVAAVGAVANHTEISLKLAAECVGDNFWTYFSGGTRNGAGRLGTPVPGIDVQLTNGTSGNAIVVAADSTYTPALQGFGPGTVQSGNTNQWTIAQGVAGIPNAYGAEFYSTDTNTAKAGSIATGPGTNVEYNIVFF